jgi:hypothetical protein
MIERLAFCGIGDGSADDEVGCGHGSLPFLLPAE